MRGRRGQGLLVAVGLVASAVAASALALRGRLVAVVVDGDSMSPALRHGDTVLARRCPGAAVRAGDIVVVRSPGWDHTWSTSPVPVTGSTRDWLIKRAVAVPGEPVPASVEPAVGYRTVPDEALVVLGDNGGYDSRTIGLVPFEHVHGTVLRVVTMPGARGRRPVVRPRGTVDAPASGAVASVDGMVGVDGRGI